MLSHANWQETWRALTSAWRCGLHVHLGITVDAECPFDHPLLSQYRCTWVNDFSAVRNALLDQIKSHTSYFLWIDSDEEVICCPSKPPADTGKQIFAARISTQAGLTASWRNCIHENTPAIRWSGAIHERLVVFSDKGNEDQGLFPGIAVVHHGYEDREFEVTKLTRNSVIAKASIADGNEHLGATASIARENAALGRATAFDWLATYRAAESHAKNTGRSTKLIYEPAAALAYCGYTRLAEQIAAENPLNIPLQLSLLTAYYAKTGTHDPARSSSVLTCLQRILWDDHFAFEAKLIGASREDLEHFIENQAKNLGWDRRPFAIDEAADTMNTRAIYKQRPDILFETFEDDLLLLSQQTNRVVSLNASGSIFWDALQSGISVEECAAMIAEATETSVTPEALFQVKAFFQNLVENGMIQKA